MKKQGDLKKKRVVLITAIIMCAAIMLCTLAVGCGTVPGIQNGYQQEPLGSTNNVSAGDTEYNNQMSLPNVYEYTSSKNIHDMSEQVTNKDGLAVQLISYEITSEFGNRKKENLHYDNIDENGRLSNGATFIFATIQFTNTTNEELEFGRNGRGFCFIDDQFILRARISDAYYIDEYWNGGMSSEVYHYRLGPGEAITSEVGYVIPKDIVDEILGKYPLYYIVDKNDVLGERGGFTDPDALFIEVARN